MFEEVKERLDETNQTVKISNLEGMLDYRLFAGSKNAHWSAKDLAYLKAHNRWALVINKIAPLIRAISGYEKKDRKAITYKPITEKDLPVTEEYSKILATVMGKSGYSTFSDIFSTAIKTGISYAVLYPSYEQDPVDGDIMLERVPFNHIVFDPSIKKKDFSDAEYLIREELFSLDKAKMLFPNKADDIERMANNKPFLNSSEGRLDNKGRVYLVEYWKRVYKPVDFVIDEQTGLLVQWQGTDKLLKEVRKKVKTVKKTVPVMEYSIYCNGTLLYKADNPYGHSEFPYIPFFCYFDPELEDDWKYKIRGVIRDLRDPQRQINKSRSQYLDILATQIHSGIIAENGAVLNPEVLREGGQGKYIKVKPGSKWEQIQDPRANPDFMNLSEIYKNDMQYISNVHEDLMGIPMKGNEPAILHQIRTAQALTALQDIFDNYVLGKKLVGKQFIKLMQKMFSPQKVIRMIGMPPAPGFYDADESRYDVQVAETVITDTQRDLYFKKLMDLRQAGFDIPLQWVLKYMDLPDKEQFIQFVQQEQQAQQQQRQQVQQMTLQGALSQARLNEAKAVKEIAKAKALPMSEVTKRIRLGLAKR